MNIVAIEPKKSTDLAMLGQLLSYPSRKFHQLLATSMQSEDCEHLAAFQQRIGMLSIDELEELYTSTFDITPHCIPYVSIHLFGEENFKRGEFMAALYCQYDKAGFEASNELPDHLAVMLRYAATLCEPDRRELVEFCLLRPIEKILGALPEAHPYHPLMVAISTTIHAQYPGIEAPLSPVEQMRQHGLCPTISDACNCGSPIPSILDGPEDRDTSFVEARSTSSQASTTTHLRIPTSALSPSYPLP